jgi:hypothetical protein
VSKKDAERKAAEAHDAAIRKLLESQEAEWEAARRDHDTVAVSLGYALPERRLSARVKKELKKRADKIICAELLKLVEGKDIAPDMRSLARIWLLQYGRGRGRPNNKVIQQLLIIQAVEEEYRKQHSLNSQEQEAQRILNDIGEIAGQRITLHKRRPLHKVVVGKVADRAGLGMERMKQLAPSPEHKINKIVRRLARKSEGK